MTAVPEYYDASAHWPIESLARLTALKYRRQIVPEDVQGKHERPKDLSGQLLLRRRPVNRQRRTGGDGLLPLRVVPALVGRPRQCVHVVEARGGEDHTGCGQRRHVQQDAEQQSQVVQDLWWSHPHRASRPGLTDVYAAVIPDFPYQPAVHVHYQETRLRIRDGLPKLQDVPKEMGGSGVSLAE